MNKDVIFRLNGTRKRMKSTWARMCDNKGYLLEPLELSFTYSLLLGMLKLWCKTFLFSQFLRAAKLRASCIDYFNESLLMMQEHLP